MQQSQRLPQNTGIGAIVHAYRRIAGGAKRPISFAGFANELNKVTQPAGLSVSYQTIKNWADGKHKPDFFYITRLAHFSPQESWQYQFAQEVIRVYVQSNRNTATKRGTQ